MINDSHKDIKGRRPIFCNEIQEEHNNDFFNETFSDHIKQLDLNKTLDKVYNFPNQCTSCRITKKLPTLKSAMPSLTSNVPSSNTNHTIIKILSNQNQQSSDSKTRSITLESNQISSKTKETIDIFKPITPVIILTESNAKIKNSTNNRPTLTIITCMLCKGFYHQNMMITSESCSHIFCKECAKQVFEKRIELNDISNRNSNSNSNSNDDEYSKCLFAFCKEKFSKRVMMSVLSDSYLCYVNGNQALLRNSFEEISSLQSKRLLQKTPNVDHYHYKQRNVIDINNNQGLFIFQGIRKTFCPFCLSYDIFHKNQTHYMICQNCLMIYCRHCKEKWVDGHMDLSNYLHCKMARVYRKEENKSSSPTIICHRLGIQILFIVASYLVLHIGIIKSLKCAIYNNYKFKKAHMQFLWSSAVIMLTVFIYLLSFPLLIVIFPYFPILTIF